MSSWLFLFAAALARAPHLDSSPRVAPHLNSFLCHALRFLLQISHDEIRRHSD